MIINTTYFLLPPLFIPNAVAQPSIGPYTPTLAGDLQAVIDRMEYDFLVNSLGHSQYLELKAQFDDEGEWIPGALQKWKDLVDGVDNWTGLRFTIGVNKVSVIAYYVYYKFLSGDRQFFTTTGLQSSEAANSVKVNPTEELIEKWNLFVEMYQGQNKCYLNWWNPIFFEWNGYPYTGIGTNYVSYLGYISDNPDLYDGSFFKKYDFKNRWGL